MSANMAKKGTSSNKLEVELFKLLDPLAVQFAVRGFFIGNSANRESHER